MSASSPLNDRLQAALTDFISDVVHYSSGENAGYVLPVEITDTAMADAYLTLISTLLARTFGRLTELDSQLFTAYPSPTQELNDVLLTCRHFVDFPQDMEDEDEDEWLEETGGSIVDLTNMVEDGKGRNGEYRWLWGFMEVLLDHVDAASEAGEVWGVEKREREDWFWGSMAAITGMGEGPKGLKGWGEAEWFEEDLERLWN